MDALCQDSSTALAWAVAARHAEMAEALICKGAKVELDLSPHTSNPPCHFVSKSLVPKQPLHVAARAGMSDLVTLLLKEGAQVGGKTDR